MTRHNLATGRMNQKARTREALLLAARQMLAAGDTPTLLGAAEKVGVSQATVYRYFTDSQTLLREALERRWSGLETLHSDLAAEENAGERAYRAGSALARAVLANHHETRALIALNYQSSTATTSEGRPAFRNALVSLVMEPLHNQLSTAESLQLKLALSAVISAETVLSLKDNQACDDDEIAHTIGWIAKTIVGSAGKAVWE